MLAEPVAEAVDERRERVDGEAGRGEVGLRGRPCSSGGVTTPEVHEARAARSRARGSTMTSTTGVPARRACSSRSAAISSALGSRLGGRLAAGSAVALGLALPAGVQRPLTLVSLHGTSNAVFTTEGSGTPQVQ